MSKRKSGTLKSQEQRALEYQLAMTEVARRRGLDPKEAAAFAQNVTRDQREIDIRTKAEKRRKRKEAKSA